MKGLNPIGITLYEDFFLETTTVLDLRSAEEFCIGFIPGSVYLESVDLLKNSVLKALVPPDEDYVLLGDESKIKEETNKLKSLGFLGIQGYIEGGFESWQDTNNPTDVIISIEPDEILLDLKFSDPEI